VGRWVGRWVGGWVLKQNLPSIKKKEISFLNWVILCKVRHYSKGLHRFLPIGLFWVE